MNKQRFFQIVSGPETIQKEDLKTIKNLEKNYPYSQVLHTLSAIGSFKNKLKDSKQKLNVAAVYAMDRAVLKDAILSSEPKQSNKNQVTTKVSSKSHTPAPSIQDRDVSTKRSSGNAVTKPEINKQKGGVVVDSPSKHPGQLTSKEAEDLRNEVMKNLENLMIIKSTFLKNIKTAESRDIKKKPEKGIKKRKKEQKKELKDNKKSNLKVVASNVATVPPKEVLQVEKAGRKNKKEQTEIIERFIKEEPALKRPKNEGGKSDQNDLSLDSVAFGKDLVSENLARILIKQGKKQKAIDIYKKLIWKYPQKKAYFASQIESLTEQ